MLEAVFSYSIQKRKLCITEMQTTNKYQSSHNFGKVLRSKPQFFQSCTQDSSLEKCNFFRVCSQIEIAPGRASCVIGSIERNLQKVNFYQGYRKVTPLYGMLSLSWVEFQCLQILPATSGSVNPEKTNKLAHLKVILVLLCKQSLIQ